MEEYMREEVKNLSEIIIAAVEKCREYEERNEMMNLLNEIGVLRGLLGACQLLQLERIYNNWIRSDEVIRLINLQNEILNTYHEKSLKER